MDVVLPSEKLQNALVYIEDIIIFLKTPEEYLSHMEQFLRLLQDAGMTIKLNKCFLIRKTIYYMRHVTSPRSFKAGQKITEAI